jgi:hypothetical protein
VLDGAAGWLAGMKADPLLGGAIVQDMLTHPEVDPAQVKAAIQSIDRDYAQDLRDAQYALDRAGKPFGGVVRIGAEELPTYSLMHLAIFGARLRQHAEGRP